MATSGSHRRHLSRNWNGVIPSKWKGISCRENCGRDSFHFEIPPAMREEVRARAEYKRPVRIVKLGREASPLVKAGTVADDRAKDFTWLFVENWQWIATSIETVRKMRERGYPRA